MVHPDYDEDETKRRAAEIIGAAETDAWNERASIDAEFKRSELRFRSDLQFDVKGLLAAEKLRAQKYDAFPSGHPR